LIHIFLFYYPLRMKESKQKSTRMRRTYHLHKPDPAKTLSRKREVPPKTIRQADSLSSEREEIPLLPENMKPVGGKDGDDGTLSFLPAEITAMDISYPYISRKRGEEGDVWAEALIGSDGRLIDVKIVKSSGYQRLDRAVLEGLKKSRIKPALENGRPVQSRRLFGPFQFRLKE